MEQLPFKCDTFDLAIATCVFEFFAEPRAAAVEVHRVLKPGGRLVMSVGGVTQRFNDGENWRFLPGAIKSALATFSKVEIVPEVTGIGGVIRFNAGAPSSSVPYELLRQILHFTAVPLLNVTGLMLEGANLTSNDQFSSNLLRWPKNKGWVFTGVPQKTHRLHKFCTILRCTFALISFSVGCGYRR